MAFFSSAIDTLQTLVIALGAGLGVWGVVNLLEGYGSDNPGSKSQGMKQLMAGGGVALIGGTLVPLLVRPVRLSGGVSLCRAYLTAINELDQRKSSLEPLTVICRTMFGDRQTKKSELSPQR